MWNRKMFEELELADYLCIYLFVYSFTTMNNLLSVYSTQNTSSAYKEFVNNVKRVTFSFRDFFLLWKLW